MEVNIWQKRKKPQEKKNGSRSSVLIFNVSGYNALDFPPEMGGCLFHTTKSMEVKNE